MSNGQQRPTWNETYMRICEIISKRSTCLFINSGAIIVDLDNHNIVGIGYNGSTKGDVHCNEVGCARYVDGELVKHGDKCRGAHGEINAIINAGQKTKGMIMYTIYTPCNNCAKHIVNAEIKKVIYKEKYGGEEYVQGIIDFLRRLGVEVEQYK